MTQDEATARALIDDWKKANAIFGYVHADAIPDLRARITAALAALTQERDEARNLAERRAQQRTNLLQVDAERLRRVIDLEAERDTFRQLAASRAEGEGQLAALVEAIEAVWPVMRGIHEAGRPTHYLTHSLPSDGDELDRIHELVRKALTTTAAAAQAYDAKVRAPLEAQLAACRHEADGVLEAENAALKQALEAKDPYLRSLWPMLRVWGEECQSRKMKLRAVKTERDALVQRVAWLEREAMDHPCRCGHIRREHCHARGPTETACCDCDCEAFDPTLFGDGDLKRHDAAVAREARQSVLRDLASAFRKLLSPKELDDLLSRLSEDHALARLFRALRDDGPEEG